MNDARSATPNSSADAPASVSGSVARQAVELIRHDPSQRERQDQAGADADGRHARARSQQHPQHGARLRAERQADADFPRPLRNRVGEHRVDADRRQASASSASDPIRFARRRSR